jgi:hypothetical protein
MINTYAGNLYKLKHQCYFHSSKMELLFPREHQLFCISSKVDIVGDGYYKFLCLKNFEFYTRWCAADEFHHYFILVSHLHSHPQ